MSLKAVFRRRSTQPDDTAVIQKIPGLSLGFVEFSDSFESFFQNDFLKSLSICSSSEKVSTYHSFAKSILCFINALTAYEKSEIEPCIHSIQSTLKLTNHESIKRRGSIVQIISNVRPKNTNYDAYSDAEVHSELISAESKLMLILIEYLKEDNSVHFLKKATPHVKYCSQSFRMCLEIMTSKTKWDSNDSKANFKSGLCLGVGILNLLLSNLPEKARKTLEEAGCFGEHELGLHYLEQAVETEGIQKPLAQLTAIAYNILLDQDFHQDKMEWCDNSLQQLKSKYKNSAFLSFLSAKVLIRRKSTDRAIEELKESLNQQSEWEQLLTVTHVNLMWSNALLLEWEKAAFYARKLMCENSGSWFGLIHQHELASFLWMIKYDNDKSSIETGQTSTRTDDDIRNQIHELLRQVKGLRKFEEELNFSQSFALESAIRYVNDGNDLLLPGIELLYHNNLLSFVPIQKLLSMVELIDTRLTQVVSERQLMAEMNESFGPALDDYLKLKLLKGLCLKHLGKTSQATESLKEIIERKHRISTSSSVLPALSMIELGSILCSNNQVMEGHFWLKTVKCEYFPLLKEKRFLIKVDKGLQVVPKENEDEFHVPGLSLRKSSVAEVSVRGLRKLARQRSNSIGFEHQNSIDST